jgi:hypothetical protein
MSDLKYIRYPDGTTALMHLPTKIVIGPFNLSDQMLLSRLDSILKSPDKMTYEQHYKSKLRALINTPEVDNE